MMDFLQMKQGDLEQIWAKINENQFIFHPSLSPYPPKTSSRPAALISRRPARLRSGKRIAPRRTSRFKRRA